MPVTYIGSSVLAKIFMVTKPENAIFITRVGSVLAKIFMVTKPKPDKSP